MIKYILALVFMAAVVLFIAGCPAAVCERLETRCAADVAQVCNDNGQWQDVMDCSQVEPGDWACGEDPDEGHTCNPVEEAAP